LISIQFPFILTQALSTHRVFMSGNTFGSLLRLTTFGESHGPSIGGILDGVPPNMPLDSAAIQQALDKRRPGASAHVTQRTETDTLEILSGVFEGKTLGTPIAFQIRNSDQRSGDYDALKDVFRPGHGDYTYHMKYGHRDHRGGGRASARETAARVAAGAVALQILEHTLGHSVTIRACVTQLGALKTPIPIDAFDWDLVRRDPLRCPCPDTLDTWRAHLDQLVADGRSTGAVIYVEAIGIPAGLGEPVFDKLDADLAKALMSINAVKAVAIGNTFDVHCAAAGYDEMKGSPTGASFQSNNAGGTLAGISSGQPITAIVGFKPTSSSKVTREAATKDGQTIDLQVHGRHDPCVALRATPIVEAMVALTLADHLLRFRGQCGSDVPFQRRSPAD
jgi:chorismate synthase